MHNLIMDHRLLNGLLNGLLEWIIWLTVLVWIKNILEYFNGFLTVPAWINEKILFKM